MKQKQKRCASCGKEIQQHYFKCLDNYMITRYFDEQDGSDNIFCSKGCFCESLSLEQVEV